MKNISKGGTDLIDDFMLEILDKFDKEVKKDILDSPLALVKLRKICEKIRINLLTKEKDTFNIMDILDNYNEQIEIKRSDYDKSSFYFYNNIRILIYDCLNEARLKEKDITDILFIGELCKDKKLVEMIERSFIQDNTFLFEKLIYSNYIDNEKDFYIVGGAAYHSINTRKNKNNNLYLFKEISNFNIGIEKYNGKLDYIIMKGDAIPVKNLKYRLKGNSMGFVYDDAILPEGTKIDFAKAFEKKQYNPKDTIRVSAREVAEISNWFQQEWFHQKHCIYVPLG